MKKLVLESLNEGFATSESQQLDEIAGALGYDGFEEFIGDNPGCMEAIIEWIEQVPEFITKLEDEDPEWLEDLKLYTIAQHARDKHENETEESDDENINPNYQSDKDFRSYTY